MAYISGWRIEELRARERTMTKQKESVTGLGFNEDGQVVHEYTDTRMVYRYADGQIEINYVGRRKAFQCGDRVIFRNWQRMPRRQSSSKAMASIVAAGTWTMVKESE